jgi:hypothetical protein
VLRFAKFESECLELCPKAFQSFLVIIPMVELLAFMVNRKKLTDAGRQAKILPAGVPHKWRRGKVCRYLPNRFQVMEGVVCCTYNSLKWGMECDIGKKGFWL